MLVVRVSMHDVKKDQPIANAAVILEQFMFVNMFTMLKVRNLERFVIVNVSILEKWLIDYLKEFDK